MTPAQPPPHRPGMWSKVRERARGSKEVARVVFLRGGGGEVAWEAGGEQMLLGGGGRGR